ncbi:MAG: hypothetical protein AABX62_03415 [Thermoproteota archaeon]|mgnify:FL=1
MTRISSVSINLGVFLIVLGTLMLLSFMGVSGLTSLQSLPLVIAIFGIWLALVSALMPAPSASYAATRPMFLGWGGVLTGLGILWFSAYYGLQLFAVVLATILIVAGIGSLGYSLMRGQAKKSSATVA